VGRAGALDLETRARLSAASARVAAMASLGIGLGLLGAAYRQADELRFPGDPLPDALQMLMGTSWATAWWWAVAGSLLTLAAGLTAVRWDRPGWWVVAVGLLPVVAFPALSGHASGAEARLLAVGLDVAHVVAAGTWIGTLGVLLLVGRSWMDRLVPAFSPIALASALILAGTGATAGWRLVGSLAGYVESPYGRVLLLKVALFALVAALGAINWRRITPLLGSPDGDRTMARSASLEFLLGQAVLVVTAILVRMAPP